MEDCSDYIEFYDSYEDCLDASKWEIESMNSTFIWNMLYFFWMHGTINFDK